MAHAPPPWEPYSEAACLELLCGNRDALDFLASIAAISHTYDDLIDRDREVPASEVHALIWQAFVVVPLNPFFRAHESMLRPVLLAGFLNWHAANDMQASGNLEQLRIAHVLRYSVVDVGLVCLEICGGHQHAMKNAARLRLLFTRDTWAHYLSEHGHASA